MHRLYYQYVKKFLWLKNIKGAYTLSVVPATDTVILLDDIVNSGNTGKACCQLLENEGVKQVYVLCLFTCRR